MAAASLTLAEAAALLEPGMTVFIHGTATEPRAFVDYIAAHPHEKPWQAAVTIYG